MKRQTYTTITDAIEREIIAAIEAGDAKAEEFDIDAIADAVIGDYEDGFALKVEESEFWETVAEHAIQ